ADPNPLTTGTLSNFVAADGVSAVYSRTAGEDVAGSPYTISTTLNPLSALDNYIITYKTTAFTLHPTATTSTIVAPMFKNQTTLNVGVNVTNNDSSPTPTGQVSLTAYDSQTNTTQILASQTLVNGSASFVITGLTDGSYQLSTIYTADTTNFKGTSATWTTTVDT